MIKTLNTFFICFLILSATHAQQVARNLGTTDEAFSFLTEKLNQHPSLKVWQQEIESRMAQAAPGDQWSIETRKNGAHYTSELYQNGQLAVELLTSNVTINGQHWLDYEKPVFKGKAANYQSPALNKTFHEYQVYELDIAGINALAKQAQNQPLAFQLEMGKDQVWELNLQPNHLFAPGFRYKVLTTKGIQYVEAPTNTIFKGKTAQNDDVRLTIVDKYIKGVVRQGEKEYFIEPISAMVKNAPTNLYVVYDAEEVHEHPELFCGTEELEERKPPLPPQPSEKMATCQKVELALAASFDMVTKFGSVADVQQHIIDITNQMELLYAPFDLNYWITDVVIPASSGADPWSTSAFMDILLPDFATWGNTGGNFEQHDIGQLWVARDVFRGSEAMPVFTLIGRADGIGVVCTADRYNVCEDFSASMNCLRSLSAHEIGHLWDGTHGNSDDGITIMSPNIVCNSTTFSAANTTDIQNHIDSRGCLEDITCCNLDVDCSDIFDQNLSCRADLPPVDFDLPIINDFCGSTTLSALTIIPGDTGCPGDPVIITRTYFIADEEFGTDTECMQTFTIQSTTGPSINCSVTAATESLDANCQFAVPNYIGTASATADCNYGVTITQSPLPGTILNGEGNTVITLTATDDCGRFTSCNLTLTLEDNEPPVAVCKNLTLTFNGEEEFVLKPEEVWDELASSDNCGLAGVTNINPPNIPCEELGNVVPVTVTIEDIYGNPANCTSFVTVEGLPCGWMDFGDDGIGCENSNDVSYDVPSETFTLVSEGCYSTNWSADDAAYVKYELCGDGELVAHVASLSPLGGGWAGISARESEAPGSKKVALATNLGNLVRREIRTTTNGYSIPQQMFRPGATWLKLTRTGNQFVGYASSNGVNWQIILVTTVPMTNCIQFGLYVTNTNGGTVTADFDNVEVIESSPMPFAIPEVGTELEDQDISLGFTAFPNPVRDELYLDLHQYYGQTATLVLLNQFGQPLINRQLDEVGTSPERLDVSNLSNGTYFIRVVTDEGQKVQKILIAK